MAGNMMPYKMYSAPSGDEVDVAKPYQARGLSNVIEPIQDYLYVVSCWVSGQYHHRGCNSSEEAMKLIQDLQANEVVSQIMLFSREKKWDRTWNVGE